MYVFPHISEQYIKWGKNSEQHRLCMSEHSNELPLRVNTWPELPVLRESCLSSSPLKLMIKTGGLDCYKLLNMEQTQQEKQGILRKYIDTSFIHDFWDKEGNNKHEYMHGVLRHYSDTKQSHTQVMCTHSKAHLHTDHLLSDPVELLHCWVHTETCYFVTQFTVRILPILENLNNHQLSIKQIIKTLVKYYVWYIILFVK